MKALQRLAQKRHKKLWNCSASRSLDFSRPSTGGGTFKPTSARGRKLILFFYPQDNTPTRRAGLSDADETACRLFGAIKMKNMHGRHVQEVLNFAKAP